MKVRLLLREIWKQLEQDDVLNLAAQCAYYFLFSLFPFLIFIMSLLGYLPVTAQDVLLLVKEYIPAGGATGIEDHLKNVLEIKRGGALSFGLIFSLVTASAAMNSIVLAVNKAYGLPPRKSFIHSRILSIALTAGMLIVVASALLLSVFGQFIGEWMYIHLHIPWSQVQLWNMLRWSMNFFILFLVLTAVYYIAPNTCLTCKDVLPGAMLAAAGWQLTLWGFSYYVNHFGDYSATYGSLGGVIVLLSWFYISALLIIIGGELNALTYLIRKRA
ncbi:MULTISPECIES: YihY/virulence factor BrkB family protein [unclassified Paenibacillus]|uniref:YihY/virulence factor BrkB family protein n=1 Tax=unclassified Paenibacillus TaxID=185978 RepID=UPI001AEAD56F|nr:MULTISPECIES: YihY/virulence factor BrkB family protein [unclassified Paenibacillus]MBP1155038.1 membrane protein [Paenibacillus sp. PvP091]MBP1169579.1 membrane protein [Paenibacillus sp. PvR098]MBP2440607.1 membrane protein [Paenibacillus sp. PvP052]